MTNPAFKYDYTYSLTPRGVAQMQELGRSIRESADLAPSWIYTSNFQRSWQSALVLREELVRPRRRRQQLCAP